jgi:ribosomal protein S18 acetylase RimI-like enzyme
MRKEIKIRKGNASDLPIIIEIAKTLKGWFTERGVGYIEQDLEFQGLIMAEADSEPVGFLSYFLYEGVGRIGWMGVLNSFHRQGIGEALFFEFEKEMKKRGIDTLQVHTLGDGINYEPYEQTRTFYRKMGFNTYLVEATENPECPENLILRKKILQGH